ncbi:two-component system regulatory protein YycI [Bacillus sp. CGMCC 1.16607]|uniref:two-component system regulatory protein YycI n=1 Tax=Bacillus sp. CGMCC 1.16607 TaxID=3351842 RepID=UPI00362B03D1
MDWSKIKTIFIISFLILDLYLTYQFLLIRDANKYELISEVSLETSLKDNEISFDELPKGPIKDQYLSAKPKEFNKEELSQLKNQMITIVEHTTVESILEKPVSLTSKFDPFEAQNFLDAYVLNGDQYGLWNFDEVAKTITFYQKFDNKMFYENINGKVVIHLNQDFQIISYEQTYLESIENLTDREEILPAIKAIEALYQKGMLMPKSKISLVEFGYSTLVQLAASQVLTPTWHFVVEGNGHLYVNAFEGQIIQFNSEENKLME